jgi:hypothetical protein
MAKWLVAPAQPLKIHPFKRSTIQQLPTAL